MPPIFSKDALRHAASVYGVRQGRFRPLRFTIQEMEEETYDVISVMINRRRMEIYKEGNRVEGGRVNMCKALNEMTEDSRRDGLQAGRRDGIRIGEKRGERNGEQKFAALAGKLMADSRTKDLEKALNNEAFRRKLYREYGMK